MAVKKGGETKKKTREAIIKKRGVHLYCTPLPIFL